MPIQENLKGDLFEKERLIRECNISKRSSSKKRIVFSIQSENWLKKS